MIRPFSLFWLAAVAAFAHQQPTTLLRLDIAPQTVTAQLHLPLTEWELAFGHPLNDDPPAALQRWQGELKSYLQTHIRPVSPGLGPWQVRVASIHVQAAEQAQSGAFQEAHVELELTPPVGGSTREFTLNYDAILHQVVTHRAIVSIGNDWQGGQTAATPAPLGVIQVNTETTRIAPLEVRLGPASRWAGALAMLQLGIRHIEEGTDHLLFLLVLLLPAPLAARPGRWGSFAGYRQSLSHLFRTITAFTAGHSLTLLTGALGWLVLPQQPVEIAIAVSVLVSAAHAVRPLFPGREYIVAGAFGLVHGMAFATGLAGLRLAPAELLLSVFSFNVGIELMQLFVVALVIPWLLIISPTPAYRWTRSTGALFAAVAAVAWILSRATGQSNIVVTAIDNAAGLSPAGILILAVIAGLSLLNKPLSPLPGN